MDTANYTPNAGLVKDPSKRRVIEQVISGAGLVLGTVMVVDQASLDFDWTQFTTPAALGYAYVVGFLGFTTTLPNIPKP